MIKNTDLARKTIFTDNIKRPIDLNADFGQSRDKAYFERTEYQLLNYVSSVNIPCCVHDGDPKEISEAIATARKFQCSVGAHIGYPDPANTGYQPMEMDADELAAWIRVQYGAFQELTKANRASVDHVRPHGALYQAFINDAKTAKLVAEVLYQIDPWVFLMAPAGPILDEIAASIGTRVAPEVYVGKRYTSAGTLELQDGQQFLPQQGAFEQARQLVLNHSLTSSQGKPVEVKFRTLHISPVMDNAHQVAEKICHLIGQPLPPNMAEIGASGWLSAT